MTESLIPFKRGDIVIQDVYFSKVGLVIARELAFDEYEVLGDGCERLDNWLGFYQGDRLVYGERVYGEQYAQVIPDGREKKYQEYKFIAEMFPPERRRESLSYSHHAETRSLEPELQDQILDKAVEYGLSSMAVRGLVKAAKGEQPKEDKNYLDQLEDLLKSLFKKVEDQVVLDDLLTKMIDRLMQVRDS